MVGQLCEQCKKPCKWKLAPVEIVKCDRVSGEKE